MLQCDYQLDLYKDIVSWESGKFITQLGLYSDCLDEANLKYGLLDFVNVTTNRPVGIRMGTCLPNICPKQHIEHLADQIFDLPSQNLTSSYIQSPQQYSPPFNPAFYVTIIILTALTLCAVLGIFLSKKVQTLKYFALSNSVKIFEYKRTPLNGFNGVKTLCMLWVIFGHLFLVRLQNNVNVLTLESQVEKPFFLIVIAAFFAVDVFFYIGGFLVAYSFLRNSMKSVLKYPLAILHRILRFWPSYLMAILIYLGIFLHVGGGPLWWRVETDGQVYNCDNFWRAMIFIDNLVDNGESMCLGYGWYLQNDMQIFILSIPILFLYAKNKRFAYISILVLMIGSLIANFVMVQINEFIVVAHRQDFAKWNKYFPNVYIKPWIRCPPYLYGLALGLLYMEYLAAQKEGKEEDSFFGKLKAMLQSKEYKRRVFQLVGLCVLIFIVVVPRTLQEGHAWPQVIHSFYLTFGKLFFVIGVSMLLTPSILGMKQDIVYFLLDNKLFNFTSKISFWTYLIHYQIIQVVCYTQKVDFYYNIGDILPFYLGIVVMSMFLGFVGTMIVEVPFAKLEKRMVEGGKKHHKGEKKQKKHQALNETVVSEGHTNKQQT